FIVVVLVPIFRGSQERGAVRPAAKPGPAEKRHVLRLMVYSGLMGSSVSLVNVYLPLYAFTSVGLDPVQAGLLTGVVGVSGVVARNCWGLFMRDDAGAQGVFRLQAAGGAAAGTILVFAPHHGTWMLWLAAALAGSTVIASNAVLMLAVV